MSKGRRLLTLGLIVVALGLLYPGVTLPVLTLSGSIEKAEIAEMGIGLMAGDDVEGRSFPPNAGSGFGGGLFDLYWVSHD